MAFCVTNTSPPAPKLALEVGIDVFVTAMAEPLMPTAIVEPDGCGRHCDGVQEAVVLRRYLRELLLNWDITYVDVFFM